MLARSAVAVAAVFLVGTTAFGADPVGTWDLVGRTHVTVCARGRCQSRNQDGGGTLTIAADGTYTVPSDLAGCSAPDEHGTWVARKRGRYQLKPSNVRDLVRALASCLGAGGIALHGGFHETFIPNADGTTATERDTFSGGGSYRGVGFTATAAARYTGTRIQPSARGDAAGASSIGTGAIVGLVERAVP